MHENCWVPPESERIIIGRVQVPRTGTLGVLDSCDDELPSGILVGSCLVNMESKVPVRVLNVRDERVRFVKGMHLGKVTEATDEIQHVFANSEPEGEMPARNSLFGSSGNIRECVPSHLIDLVEKSSKGMTQLQRQALTKLLCEYDDVFSREEYDLGTFTAIKHSIDTGNAKPIRQPARRTPLSFQAEEAKYLQKRLDAGVVVPSCSAWASPVVLVRKKDGGVRWCVDYRKVNEATQKDAYPLPKIEECLDTLSGSKLFSILDLLSGYHQFKVNKKDRPKTTFITKHGLFEYTRMPFGLCNASSTFQRDMELVLRGLQWVTLLIYLDDVIITGKTFKEHLNNLGEVLSQLARWLEELSQCSFIIQHRAGKSHGNADALSRRDGEACDCYNAGKRAESLPCGGCKYYRKVEEQWERFTNEVDYVVPLTTRRVIQPEPDCNWMESYNMNVAQAEDKEAQLLIRYEEKLTHSELRLMDPAMRCYYSCIQQFRMVK